MCIRDSTRSLLPPSHQVAQEPTVRTHCDVDLAETSQAKWQTRHIKTRLLPIVMLSRGRSPRVETSQSQWRSGHMKTATLVSFLASSESQFRQYQRRQEMPASHSVGPKHRIG